jgi:hypothetical protein
VGPHDREHPCLVPVGKHRAEAPKKKEEEQAGDSKKPDGGDDRDSAER